jgi:hypothetical protein
VPPKKISECHRSCKPETETGPIAHSGPVLRPCATAIRPAAPRGRCTGPRGCLGLRIFFCLGKPNFIFAAAVETLSSMRPSKLILLSGYFLDAFAMTGCNSTLDCSLNGGCQDGACVCSSPWNGPACDLLQIVPSTTSGPAIYGVSPNVSSWGGSVVKWTDGKFHLFVAEMSEHCGMVEWQTNSFVTHAVSDTINGTYTKVSVAVKHWAHNPQAIVFNDEVFIFHIGPGDNTAQATNCSAPPRPMLDHCFHRIENTLPDPRKPAFKKLGTDTRQQCEQASLADSLSSGFSMEHSQPEKRCWIYRNVTALGNGTNFSDGDWYAKIVPVAADCSPRLHAGTGVDRGVAGIGSGSAPDGRGVELGSQPTYIHSAPSPDGPFTLVVNDTPACDNPSPLVLRNQTVLLMCSRSPGKGTGESSV